ncbi:TIGR03086 family metal-binding protein [uncultured Nocardioides sp.]|uniref:TIGR03086 family metal-binding protein n=1 Tax=uncultured Nocardioides sp. TaxID=198441 RepID=UPI00262EBED4|nr:TIGR03086 family metal-binding protein [uncultured Nocardioides sp.]
MTPDPSSGPALDVAVELLERSLGHTRMALAAVRPVHLARPTPCDRWDLDDLLWHMDDALDAFTEAASGRVLPAVARPAVARPAVARPAALAPEGASGVEARLGRLQRKACHLLGLWSAPSSAPVLVGGLPLPAERLVGAAALEITVHGWDVSQATGEARPIPSDLATALLPVAAAAVGVGDRGPRFARALLLPGGTPADRRLLAFLGRAPRRLDDVA